PRHVPAQAREPRGALAGARPPRLHGAPAVRPRRRGRRGLSRSPARALPADRLGRPLPRRRRRERAERVDALGRRPPAAHPDRAGAGLRVRRRRRLPPAPDREPDLAMTSMPVLSIVTWAPFVGALLIMFAGVFASWTVTVRSQEFYALLLVLVTGVYGVFVSLDLLVFFLFYELAVLPMYLLIGIWGSSGDVRPRGIFAWAFRATGVGTTEYAAMQLTL